MDPDQSPFETFYDGERFLRFESHLSQITWDKRAAFRNPNARRHFNHGFCWRMDMLTTSRMRLREMTAPTRSNVMSPYEATEAQIHINAYYLNLRGSFDNLAWALQWEHGLFPEVNEGSRKGLSKVNLFGKEFLRELSGKNERLSDRLGQYREWGQEIRKLRDPAAHRIPIYLPPGVFTSEVQVAEFRRIEALAALPEAERGCRSRGAIMMEAAAAATFRPIAVVSTTEGLSTFGIGTQLGIDHEKYLAAALVVVEQL